MGINAIINIIYVFQLRNIHLHKLGKVNKIFYNLSKNNSHYMREVVYQDLQDNLKFF